MEMCWKWRLTWLLKNINLTMSIHESISYVLSKTKYLFSLFLEFHYSHSKSWFSNLHICWYHFIFISAECNFSQRWVLLISTQILFCVLDGRASFKYATQHFMLHNKTPFSIRFYVSLMRSEKRRHSFDVLNYCNVAAFWHDDHSRLCNPQQWTAIRASSHERQGVPYNWLLHCFFNSLLG